jgi:hypothetical protein
MKTMLFAIAAIAAALLVNDPASAQWRMHGPMMYGYGFGRPALSGFEGPRFYFHRDFDRSFFFHREFREQRFFMRRDFDPYRR